MSVQIERDRLYLTLDGNQTSRSVNVGDNRFLDLHTPLYIGGLSLQVIHDIWTLIG